MSNTSLLVFSTSLDQTETMNRSLYVTAFHFLLMSIWAAQVMFPFNCQVNLKQTSEMLLNRKCASGFFHHPGKHCSFHAERGHDLKIKSKYPSMHFYIQLGVVVALVQGYLSFCCQEAEFHESWWRVVSWVKEESNKFRCGSGSLLVKQKLWWRKQCPNVPVFSFWSFSNCPPFELGRPETSLSYSDLVNGICNNLTIIISVAASTG